MMPALTIQQPWASGIWWGFKEYETRDWHAPDTLPPGRWLAIHAASYGNPKAAELNRRLDLPGVRRTLGVVGITPMTRVHSNMPMGEVIAIARLEGYYPCADLLHRGRVSDTERDYGDWTQKWAWRLTDVLRLSKGIACPGKQGIFRLQPNVTLLVATQLIAERKIRPTVAADIGLLGP